MSKVIKQNGSTEGMLQVLHEDPLVGADLEEELVRRWKAHDSLVEALKNIVTDHDERIISYPDAESQPHKVKVMKDGRDLLEKEEF